jgi:hypothetical protein
MFNGSLAAGLQKWYQPFWWGIHLNKDRLAAAWVIIRPQMIKNPEQENRQPAARTKPGVFHETKKYPNADPFTISIHLHAGWMYERRPTTLDQQ